MKHATAVAVLSDYESWSMVITKQRFWGTINYHETSGALEQIEHMETAYYATLMQMILQIKKTFL